MNPETLPEVAQEAQRFDRRKLLVAGGAGLAGALAYPWLRRAVAAHPGVFIARNQHYDGSLEKTIRDGLLAAQLKSNPHAPERYRVNGVVMNLDAFQKAFGVEPKDALYLPPERRVELW